MAYANTMTGMLNMIEDTMGLTLLLTALPEEFQKKNWVRIIQNVSIPSFSRYFPYKFPYHIDRKTARKKGDWYYLNEELIGNATILGISDLDWHSISSNSMNAQIFGVGTPDMAYLNLDMEDIIELQQSADMASFFNNGVYIEFKAPNMFRLVGINNTKVDLAGDFDVNILLQHNISLTTIPPTAMEIFENLCKSDVCGWLYNNLRYYELETTFINIDLKLSQLENEAGKRDSIMDEIKNSYVTAANSAIPFIWAVN